MVTQGTLHSPQLVAAEDSGQLEEWGVGTQETRSLEKVSKQQKLKEEWNKG